MSLTRKQQQVIAGGAVLSVAIVGIGYVALVRPATSKISSIQAQTSSQNTANQTLQGQIQQLEAQQSGLLAKQVELKDISQEIPSNDGIVDLIHSLSTISAQTKVDVVSFVPSTPTGAATAVTTGRPTGATARAGQPASAAAAGSATSTAAAAYQTIPIALGVQGDYSQLVMFLDKMEQLKRLYLVKSLTIAPLREGAAATGATVYSPNGGAEQAGDLSASITGEVYMTSADTTSIDLPALNSAAGSAAAPTK